MSYQSQHCEHLVTLFGRWKPAPAIRDMFRSNFPTILVGIDISGTDHVRMGWLIRSLTFILSSFDNLLFRDVSREYRRAWTGVVTCKVFRNELMPQLEFSSYSSA